MHCALFASPTGSDATGNGSINRPFSSPSKLDAALSPGQTGCLRAGRYGGLTTWHQIDRDGAPSRRITLTAYPGESVTVVGDVEIDANYTTISHLGIDGSNTFYKQHPAGVNCSAPASQPLTIVGHDDILEYDNYYQSVPSLRGNGIGVGFWGDADNTIIRYNRIHDVGSCQAYDHLIYLSHGNNVRIYDNWMWNDPHGRGIQLYPDPTNARIWGNVIDNTGLGFGIGDEAGDQPTGNEIFDNVVMHSVGLRWENLGGAAINVYWGGQPQSGNTFTDNDLFGVPAGVGYTPNLKVQGNVSVAPRFVNATAHNYIPAAASAVAGWHLWNGQ
ncbi:MAG TPA: right-handed parallel beta-helix repeat-containing protein [Solirubrobacteraceae bacterium]